MIRIYFYLLFMNSISQAFLFLLLIFSRHWIYYVLNKNRVIVYRFKKY